MQMFIRLYDPGDMDLIFLKLKYRSKFPGMIRSCLRAHVHDEPYQIRFRGNVETFAKHVSEPICINLNLRSEKDADVITFLEGIRDYSKSDVIKTIVRSCYEQFPSVLFRPPFIGKEYLEGRREKPAFKKPVPGEKKKTGNSLYISSEQKPDKEKPNTEEKKEKEMKNIPEKAEIKTIPAGLSGTSSVPSPDNIPVKTDTETVKEKEKPEAKKPEVKPEKEPEEPMDAFDMLSRMING